MSEEQHHPNEIECDNSVDITVILIPLRNGQQPHAKKLVILMNSNFQQSIIDTFSSIEMESSVRKNQKGHRPGTASGVFQLGDKSQSFSPVTQKETTLYLTSSKLAVNMKARYCNENGDVKHCNFGYKEMLMKRLTTQQKLSEARRYHSYNHILQPKSTDK